MKKEQKTKTDFEALTAMTDADIDCSDIEAFTEEFLSAVEGFAEIPEKELVSIRIDKPVLNFYRRSGKGYQTRMNAVLRAYAQTVEKYKRLEVQ